MWTYEQLSGKLTDASGKLLAVGYAGNRAGLNNPAMQDSIGVGPLPVGLYTIGTPVDKPDSVGEFALSLTPDPTNEMFGRADFYIHGDNPQMDWSASDGCIVLARFARDRIAESGDNRLQVVSGSVAT